MLHAFDGEVAWGVAGAYDHVVGASAVGPDLEDVGDVAARGLHVVDLAVEVVPLNRAVLRDVDRFQVDEVFGVRD